MKRKTVKRTVAQYPRGKRPTPRLKLLRALADHIVLGMTNPLPNIPSKFLPEISQFNDPLEWFRAQPEYMLVYQDRHRHHHKESHLPLSGKTDKEKGQRKPKKRRPNQPKISKSKSGYVQVRPLNDGGIDHVLKEMDASSKEPFDLDVIDWSST